MAGLLQIIIWIGCVHLVLKGIGILQAGLASSNPKKGELLAVGYAAVIIGLIAAVACFGLAEVQIDALSDPLGIR